MGGEGLGGGAVAAVSRLRFFIDITADTSLPGYPSRTRGRGLPFGPTDEEHNIVVEHGSRRLPLLDIATRLRTFDRIIH